MRVFMVWRMRRAVRGGTGLLSEWGEEFLALWRLVRNLILALGIVLSFVVLVEIINFYQFLSTLNRTVAITVTVFLATALLWFPVKFVASLLRTPASIRPPGTKLSEDLTIGELQDHRKFLARFLERLSHHPMLSEEERTLARNGLAEARRLDSRRPVEFVSSLRRARQQYLLPLVQVLDGKAKEEVRKAAAHISGGVMASPYQSLDALIAFARTTAMALKVIRIHYARPTIKETGLILFDVARVVAVVNVLNLGGMAARSLSGAPVVGGIASAVGQGFGAGVFVLVVGGATRRRCQALEKWDVEEARAGVVERIGEYGQQAAGIVMSGMTVLRDRAPEAVKSAWEATQAAVSTSLDSVIQLATTAGAAAWESTAKLTELGSQALRNVAGSAGESTRKAAELLQDSGEKVAETVKSGKWYRRKKYVPPERKELQ